MSGFEFRETMSGSFHLAASPDRARAMSFTVGASVSSLARFLRDRTAQIQGEVDLEGFARHRPLRGRMELDPIFGRRIVYDFRFADDRDRMHRFFGQTSIELLRFFETMTHLRANIEDEAGALVAEARLRFDARSDLAKFLRSFRPRRLA